MAFSSKMKIYITFKMNRSCHPFPSSGITTRISSGLITSCDGWRWPPYSLFPHLSPRHHNPQWKNLVQEKHISLMGSIAKGKASTTTVLYFGSGAIRDAIKATAAIPAGGFKKSLLHFISCFHCNFHAQIPEYLRSPYFIRGV